MIVSSYTTAIRRNACYGDAAPRGSDKLGMRRAIQGVDERLRNVETGLLHDFLKAGRARDVDLGEAVADHVQADQQQPARRELRADRLGDLAVARRERLRDAIAAGRKVAANLAALRNARE